LGFSIKGKRFCVWGGGEVQWGEGLFEFQQSSLQKGKGQKEIQTKSNEKKKKKIARNRGNAEAITNLDQKVLVLT